jgi:fumarate reductase flavoprotein subunit
MTLEKYDLVVAGAGGGLIGAIKAAQLGYKVLLIDASPDFVNTCNTSMTSGMFPASGTRWQKQLGIEDSPEKFQTDVMAKTNSTADITVTKALTEISVELVEWMSDSLGVPWELVTDFHYPGHSVDRCLSVPGRMGILVLEPIWNEAKKQNLFDFMPSTRLQDIVVEDNKVVAAVVELADGKLQEISAKNVLIATNGYGANQKLLYEHNTEICYVHFQGSKYSRGDALAIGTKHELATGFLDAYQGHAAVAAHSKTLVGWTTIMQGGFILNLEGLRFGDESAGYSEYAAILNEQKSNSGWLIIDKGINDQSMLFKEYEITAASGAIVWAESLEELADKISIPVENLTAEVHSAALVNQGLEKDRFGRTDFARPLVAPFGAIKVRPALFHTQGGLMINEKAQSIKEDGTIVENLFVAGGAAIGISGHGSDGYLAGNGLLSAFGLAYIAAKSLKPDQG